MAKRNGVTIPGSAAELEEVFQPITLHRIRVDAIVIPITGVTPVIPHRWTEKARHMMLAKQQGKVKEKPAPKNPEQEAHDAMYWLDDGRPGIPATAFKGAIADAARFFDKSTSIEMLKRVIYVEGEGVDQLVPVTGDLALREDMPRNSGGVADLRYRYAIFPWRADLTVKYVASKLTPESVISIVDAAGYNGVGDWRPSSPKSKTGTFGQWRVVTGG